VPLDDGAETGTVASLLLAFVGAWLVAESVLHPVSVVTTTMWRLEQLPVQLHACIVGDKPPCKSPERI